MLRVILQDIDPQIVLGEGAQIHRDAIGLDVIQKFNFEDVDVVRWVGRNGNSPAAGDVQVNDAVVTCDNGPNGCDVDIRHALRSYLVAPRLKKARLIERGLAKRRDNPSN